MQSVLHARCAIVYIAYDRPRPRVRYKMAKRKGTAKSSKRGKPIRFTVGERRHMLEELDVESYEDLVDSVIEKLRSGLHLERYDGRRQFVLSICSERVRPALVQCIMEMVARYLEIYKACMKGKKYARFQQQFFEHIEEYMKENGVQSDLWKTVVCRVNDVPNQQEQRIIISTLAYHVHDLMAERVKDFKKGLSGGIEEQSPITSCSSERFVESNISLLRYGGFALHSMLLKRHRNTSVVVQASAAQEIELLKSIKATDQEWDTLPSGIKYLQQGGLDIISPRMLPFLRHVVEKIASLVNDKTLREQGRYMIKAALCEIEADAQAMSLFNEQVPSTFSTHCKVQVCSELIRKVFHARTNEYMTAAEEIQLEKEGRVVKAEQSLRDSLKTLSGLKTRN